MSIDFRTALQDGTPIKIITSITNIWSEVLIPPSTQRITVGCALTDLYFTFGQTDGESAEASEGAFVAAGAYFEITIPHGIDSFCVAAQSGTAANVVVAMEDK